MFHKRFLNVSLGAAFKRLSKNDFKLLGEEEVAYIKTIGGDIYTIHSADGTPIGFSDSRDMAELAIRENDLIPVSVQ